MKLLLLQPPIEDFYDTDIRLQPIGLGYLKAIVRKHLPHVQVIVKDYHHGWSRHTVSLPSEFSYLKNFYAWPDQSPFCTFYSFYHFGAAFETIGEDVASERPDLVGISSLFSPYYREVLRTAEEIKERLPVPIIVGGSHASAAPLTLLRHPAIDFIVRGEGERPLVEFLRALDVRNFRCVPNLGYKENDRFVLNESQENFPLAEIPPPDFSEFPPERYTFAGRPLSFVLTSRGCPHQCTFCSVQLTFPSYRRRCVKSVLEELQIRYEEGYRAFDFEDDNLTFNVREIKYLCRRLIEAFPNRDVQFLAMNGVSYLSLDAELLTLMREAGFTHLNLSLVSTSEEVARATKRPHSLEKYTQIVCEAARLGFEIVSYQILGLPGETLDSMIETLVFPARLPVLLGASMFYLTPGSPIANTFSHLHETDIVKARLTAMAIETPDFRREDIYTLFVATRIINFLKGIHFQEGSLSLKEVLDIARNEGGRSATGAELLEKLLTEKRLYAATKSGFRPLDRFDAHLFFTLWSCLKKITTQRGKTIII